MIGKKLRKLLPALNPTEFRRMRKIFQSPIYTSNPNHLKLYDYIRQFYPNFDSPRLMHKKVFEKVYDGQAFEEKKLWNLVTEFTQLVEEYLILLDNRANDFQRKKQLTNIYGERNLYDFFEKGTKGLLSDLEASPYREMNYYLHWAQLNEAWYFHPMKNKYDVKDTSLEDLIDSLDKYFVLAKMRFGIAAKNVERILKKQYELTFFDAMEKEKIFSEDNILAKLYQYSFKLITEQKAEYFIEFEKLFFEHSQVLNFEGKRLLFFNGLNYITQRLNEKNKEFDKKAFEWSKFGLLNNLFDENGQMNDMVFSNIVLSGCRVNEYNWTKNFIEKNKSKLEIQIQHDVYNYNLGVLFFYQKDYDKAISILMNFPFSPSYILRSRLFIIRIMFKNFLADTEYFEVLISNIHSFEIYLIRSKYFSKAKLEPHLNFIRIIKKMAKKIISPAKKEVIKEWLMKELNTSKKIGGKSWLLEIMNEL